MNKRINIVLPKDHLAERLKQGALANSQRDIELVQDWLPIDEEAWRFTEPPPDRHGPGSVSILSRHAEHAVRREPGRPAGFHTDS
jgi:hypothetical protein